MGFQPEQVIVAVEGQVVFCHVQGISSGSVFQRIDGAQVEALLSVFESPLGRFVGFERSLVSPVRRTGIGQGRVHLGAQLLFDLLVSHVGNFGGDLRPLQAGCRTAVVEYGQAEADAQVLTKILVQFNLFSKCVLNFGPRK